MSISAGSIPKTIRSDPQKRGVRDYIALMKPLIVALQLMTTLTAMILATGGWPDGGTVIWTLLGGALTAGGASALNQYIDRDRDRLMGRTAQRPLPQGRMDASKAVIFGLVLCAIGPILLAIFVNLLSATLAVAGVFYYVVFYSSILKPTSPQNIVIGGGAGAIPPLVGWAAATGELSPAAFFLSAVVFFWTPSHFWALALIRKQDYLQAGIPMFPIAYGEEATRWQILLYAIQVVALTLILPVVRLGSWFFVLSAFVLGSGLIYHAWQVLRHADQNVTWRLYRYSNRYLALVFMSLVLDTLL